MRWQQKKGAKPLGSQRADPRTELLARDFTPPQLHLPAWLMSAFKTLSGREVVGYTSPSSLECKRSTLPKISQPNVRLYQVPSVCCAGRLTKSVIHIHKTNCTVVAVDDVLGVVYMTCVTGAPGHKITESGRDVKVVNMHSALGEDGKVQSVAEVKGRCIHWVMFDEEDMRLLIEKGQFTF